ncbi:MAG: hypothetical protein J6X28_01540 [Bacilli bacterium]|nr:hypothetical protein [Bacilli bacterium]
MEDKETIKKQHVDNYRKAVLDNIENNTNVLVHQDIVSLLQKPPLDSMDLIRTKFLDLAKKNQIVLNTEELSSLLDHYREYLLECCEEIQNVRVVELSSKVNKTKLKGNDTIKINKKDFVLINKKIKSILKDKLINGYDICILKQIDKVFLDAVDSSVKERIASDLSKYVKGTYQKQLLESMELKIMVKDTTLMNGTKEQGERYLFTLDHSRLLHEIDT